MLASINSAQTITPVVYGDLLSCIEKYESSGNPNAVGDNGKANSVLQFWFSTYKMYCVDKFGFLEEDYKNPDVQRQCASEMLNTNFSNINNWTTADKCLR